MKTGCIIQARLGSTRLPGKVLMDIGGKTALERVIERVKKIRGINQIVVATPDSEIHQKAWDCDVSAWLTVQPEQDVLSRYYDVATAFEFNTIVRITADCPLLDPEIASRVLENYYSRGVYDYYSNAHPPTFPDGMDVEVFSYNTLCRAWTHGTGPEREHVTPYIWRRPYKFRIGNLMQRPDQSGYRMTLDTQDDLDYIRKVYEVLGDRVFSVGEVLALPFSMTLQRNPVLV